jgi:hypothetical protein
MSLKAFHLVFVIASCALTLGFGVWLILAWHAGEASRGALAGGITSLLCSVAIVAYGRYFLKKLKDISYL